MPNSYAQIAFTPAVKAAQEANGSRTAYARFEQHDDAPELTPRETGFVAARDGFYQATVSEDGWPYVQFRGGPAGFLKVLDARTLGYADFRGNRQYISVGNLSGDDRVSLMLMDYANRRRLKIFARARIVEAAGDPELVARLTIPEYKARVERGVILTVEAFDWNCPQHITPRWTEAEFMARLAGLQAGAD